MASVAMARVPQIPRRFYLGFNRVFFLLLFVLFACFLVFGPVLRPFLAHFLFPSL